ncbi:MAG: hypothetical protein APF76_14555 [Desulfitibacter sp. BRH_c19]|nr:MAG: hypothetical protein APF76_14555 [Desulfitibacter sp. BRH_c19]
MLDNKKNRKRPYEIAELSISLAEKQGFFGLKYERFSSYFYFEDQYIYSGGEWRILGGVL